MTKTRKVSIAHERQVLYHDLFERFGRSPTRMQRYLLEEYGWKVNQGTIYYSWYKVRSKMSEMSPLTFIKKNYGDNVVSIDKMMREYAAYQLSLHTEQIGKTRIDIKNKIKELNNEGMARH